MDTLIYPTHCEIVVDSPDNNDDIRELAKICREWIFNKQIVLLRRQNTDSNYFAKIVDGIARDGIYNWRQCSWMPNGDLIEIPEQWTGNVGYTSTPVAGNQSWDNARKPASALLSQSSSKPLHTSVPFGLMKGSPSSQSSLLETYPLGC